MPLMMDQAQRNQLALSGYPLKIIWHDYVACRSVIQRKAYHPAGNGWKNFK
jgi:hypothetical protein